MTPAGSRDPARIELSDKTSTLVDPTNSEPQPVAQPMLGYQQRRSSYHTQPQPPALLPLYSGYAPINRLSSQSMPNPQVSSKRVAGPHPSESPAKKKQSKWTADEDAAIIELRGNGMKWEDISKHLPGRSAISCRLRFQNYLERRSEWDEEKKNKLARLYERFKKDMWEKIAKEMQLPWRAAEAMHWQIGEVEMAQRANVPVFHLACQSSGNTSMLSESRPNSTSPSSTTLASSISYSGGHGHGHSLPLLGHPGILSSVSRRVSIESLPPDAAFRPRADSVRSIAPSMVLGRMSLPPLGDITSSTGPRINLPPVVTSAEAARR